jgi:hypothetical protein
MVQQGATRCGVEGCGAIYVVVLGEPASKANSRRLVHIGGKPRFIKSKKALAFEKEWGSNCPVIDNVLDRETIAYIRMYYTSRRPDMDESLVLDLLQGRLIKNDRQIRERHTYWGLDRQRPRSCVLLVPLEACACGTANGCLFEETFGEEGCVRLDGGA